MPDWIPAQKRTVVGEVVESDPPGLGPWHRTAVSFLIWVTELWLWTCQQEGMYGEGIYAGYPMLCTVFATLPKV